MYFYATRNDKNGNKLVTSYGKQSQAEKYGGGGSISKGMHYLDANGRPSREESEYILRSKLECKPSAESEGRFQIFALSDGCFVPTPHKFDTYGNANTGMKALAPVLGTLAVVELGNVSVEEPTGGDLSDEDPF